MAEFGDALGDAELSIRRFEADDRRVVIEGREAEFHRFLGEGSPEPAPAARIWVDERIVGWIDYGTRALTLLCGWLERRTPRLRPTLLIDPANIASLALAGRAGFGHVMGVDGAYLLALADRDHRAATPKV